MKRGAALTLRHTPVPAGIAGKRAGWIAAGLMPRASPVTENLRAWVRYPTARPPDRHAARSRGIRKSASGTRRLVRLAAVRLCP